MDDMEPWPSEDQLLPDGAVWVEEDDEDDEDDHEPWVDLAGPTSQVELYLQLMNSKRWRG